MIVNACLIALNILCHMVDNIWLIHWSLMLDVAQ